MTLPAEVSVNAWVNGAPVGASALQPPGGYLGAEIKTGDAHLQPELASPSDWRHGDVGWGLVLPENGDLAPAERATPKDCPAPIQHLWEDRGKAPILRFDPNKGSAVASLRRYYDNGEHDPDLVGSDRGIARGRLPRYLLMYGSPQELPWHLQYELGYVAYTGRLDLTGVALENYVTALCNQWQDAPAQSNHAVIWAAFHGAADITGLMLGSIASKVHEELAGDVDIGPDRAMYINGSITDATHSALRAALTATTPGLVVTTSHGSTGPLDDVDVLRADLGKLVDNAGELIDIDALLAGWQPGGAIWYAHACCSAGTASSSAYAGLLAVGSPVDQLLTGLTAAGDVTAPLPRALLGAAQPLRAFIGHVEPTFDWTLQSPQTKQILTSSIRRALYRKLYQPWPVGLALDELHQQGTQLRAFHNAAKARFGLEDTSGEMLALQLTASDRESLVTLGDPTATLPPL